MVPERESGGRNKCESTEDLKRVTNRSFNLGFLFFIFGFSWKESNEVHPTFNCYSCYLGMRGGFIYKGRTQVRDFSQMLFAYSV